MVFIVDSDDYLLPDAISEVLKLHQVYAKDNNVDNMGNTAINYYGFKTNFKVFFDKVDKIANSFSALGVKKGDIVTICSPTFPPDFIS